MTLADRTEGDVRCCLNTLQFLGRRRGAVRSADAASACAGHKDIATSAFAMWQQLLWQRVSVPLDCLRQLPEISSPTPDRVAAELTPCRTEYLISKLQRVTHSQARCKDDHCNQHWAGKVARSEIGEL